MGGELAGRGAIRASWQLCNPARDNQYGFLQPPGMRNTILGVQPRQ